MSANITGLGNFKRFFSKHHGDCDIMLLQETQHGSFDHVWMDDHVRAEPRPGRRMMSSQSKAGPMSLHAKARAATARRPARSGPSLAFERSAYARPRFHLVYTAAILDNNARRLYDKPDERRYQPVQHYLGVGVEWWINSSSY